MTVPSRYADWKAPDDDGELVLWPDPQSLLQQTRQNHDLLGACDAAIQNLPLSELRRQQRRWLGHQDDSQPLIATGHQAELHHPGVWVKNVVIDRAARATAGRALHLAVDSDAPKHLQLRWPGGAMPVTDDPGVARSLWVQLLESPSPAHIGEMQQAVDQAADSWDFKPLLPSFFEGLLRLAPQQLCLSDALNEVTHQIDWELGLRHQALVTSPIWSSPPYLAFAHHFLARGGELAGQYNASLTEYRRAAGIHSPGRPMPDLQVTSDRVEAPFWLDNMATPARQRLMLSSGPGGCRLEDLELDPHISADEAAARLGKWLRGRRYRLAPRALMLTMFFRLLIADQFVHGIGGGRYDQVTDALMRRHFGIDPPRFCVTTATLYFPAARGRKRINLRPLLQEGRRLRHGSFWREKRDMAGAIAALPRLSLQRRELFYAMHARLAEHAGSPSMRQWTAQLEDAVAEQARQRTLFDRELFYAIQPRERLLELVARYDAAFAS